MNMLRVLGAPLVPFLVCGSGAQLVAQTQFAELAQLGLPGAFGKTSSIAIADFDNDGDLDIVFGNSGWNPTFLPNQMFRNDGFGRFQNVSNQLPTTPSDTQAMAVGDIDSDGDLDIVLAQDENGSPPGALIYRNNGLGSFTATLQPIAANDYYGARAVALGDLDGDGDLDYVLGRVPEPQFGTGGANRIFLNNGTGSFTPAANLPPHEQYTDDIQVADFDGDGDLDMVVGNFSGPHRLYLNNGVGVFSEAPGGSFPAASCGGWKTPIAVGDVDADGDIDILIGCNVGGTLQLLINSGSANFTNATAVQLPAGSLPASCVALGDIDGDGDLDIVAGNNPPSGAYRTLLLNDGTGTFGDASARLSSTVDLARTLAFGDLDQDGDLDLVVGDAFEGFGPVSRIEWNLQRQLHATAAAQLGQQFSLDAYMRYAPASLANFAACYLSPATATAYVPPFGTLFLNPSQMVPLPVVTITPATGVGTVGFLVPVNPSLVGFQFFVQAMMISYPTELRLSNAITATVQ